MYICNECGRKFEELKVITEHFPYGESSAPYDWYVCPYCEDTDVSEMEECSRCGRHISKDEAIIDDTLQFLCEYCYEDLFYE